MGLLLSNCLSELVYGSGPWCLLPLCVSTSPSAGASSSGGWGSSASHSSCACVLFCVDDAIEGGGVFGWWGNPSAFSREWAHTSRVVLGSAYKALEDLQGGPCHVGVSGEHDVADDCSPLMQCQMVLGWWVYVNVPSGVASSSPSADALLGDKV